jgi:hypothetical protein
MKRIFVHFLIGILLMQASFPLAGWGQELTPDSQSLRTTSESNAGIPPILGDDEEYPLSSNTIFDDKMLLQGYTERYKTLSQEIILEMIKDDTLTSYKAAAAVRVLREKYLNELPLREKRIFEKFLLRRLNRTDSPFVQVEILHTLCFLDRYRYFNPMVPALIQKMDHYNSTVDEMAFEALMDIIKKGNDRAREARIIFNTLRKVLFLSRKRLANIKEPGPRLSEKFQLLRWSIKILGTQELKSLPKEVINLM